MWIDLPLEKKDITGLWGLQKPLISWRYHRFHSRCHHLNILCVQTNWQAVYTCCAHRTEEKIDICLPQISSDQAIAPVMTGL